ncbi:glutamate 5-kinase [Candidatus Falkowbacteria bacterium RIFOXYB2_FULL_47_14]|uniref:Glutamate 5-kinase n=1 Tax=Candidatus Falkowbacteria bacterium RIFOXYA2_FULL_47_19 TaxID=1797994 RepID=A0A1F5SLX8_9BACT|nr:MAG: glutamate 5-kinase [Candidatus Falkowbacteria bacterium RIFOXYA2_FULL_47_19]OGF34707.1 MAG: glutamate 5-kinase [Candidatus Falkowbacteria bacterium RIFOXYC2_FULL_46_15]OGF42865.1 MAG: glutamate 5-kinase [Candidatus Falkowbacteria bacterium RIFOXYB2_FULL_47_14]
MNRQKNMKKKLVVKIGTSTLTAGTDRISYGKIEDIARQTVSLKKSYDIVLVSSGAIAAARQFIDINGHRKRVDSKQAMAAIGQPKLMGIYDEVFGSFGLKTAQCLMTYRDFEDKTAKNNTRNTIGKLLENDYIPIINENDTVAIEEIILGDNDKLSALVASIIKADLLVIASDIDGLYDKNPHLNENAVLIEEVKNLKRVAAFAEEKRSGPGTGGMTSKIQAAAICRKNKIEMWIVNGAKNGFLVKALGREISFTKFKF